MTNVIVEKRAIFGQTETIHLSSPKKADGIWYVLKENQDSRQRWLDLHNFNACGLFIEQSLQHVLLE